MLDVMEKQTVLFDAVPESYRHWKLKVDGRVATLLMDVNEDAGLRPGYKLKLNSYDLGVDIELHDVLQRIRFRASRCCVRGDYRARRKECFARARTFTCWGFPRMDGK